jgi:FkbM family methyltransferase
VVGPEEQLLLDLVAERAPSPLRAIDVGANVGDYSAEILARRPEARVMAFEPQRAAYSELKRRLGGRVYTYECGLAAEQQRATLHTVSGQPTVQATIVSRPDLDSYHGTGLALLAEEDVFLERLDATRWEEVLGLRIHLLKVDVEGHELAVLEGAEKTLRHTDLVQFEFNDCAIHAGVTFQDIEFVLREFRIYALTSEGLAHHWLAWVELEDGHLRWRGPSNFVAISDRCNWWRPPSAGISNEP